MRFDSFEFVVLYVIVFALYRVLPHRAQNGMLLAASYFFYGWWDWRFLSLLFASSVLDYACGLMMHRYPIEQARRRRLWLCLSLAGNLGMLGVFKYYGFFMDNLVAALGAVGIAIHPRTLNIVLPVGISFYTFQTMTYSIDIYRGRLAPTRRFFDFMLYVSFFPQLVAGPIERAGHLLPQILQPRRVTWAGFTEGGWLIYWGLFKKMFIADNAAHLTDRVFAAPQDFSAAMIWLATYAFAVQIYCDFSGYSDMARGLARQMGFDICRNFDHPYISTNPQEFWRRWHISLSEWLRDYLYIPLGGGRGSRGRVFFNLMATMTLGGLWHGAQWHFVFWGVFHGFLLMAYRLAAGEAGDRILGASSRWRRAAAIALFFHLTCLGWMLFRFEGQHLSDFLVLGGQLLGDWRVGPEFWREAARLAGFCLLGLGVDVAQYRMRDDLCVLRWPVWARTTLYLLMYLSLTLGGSYEARNFIYFQF